MFKLKRSLWLLTLSFILLLSLVPFTFSSFRNNQYSRQEAKNASFDLDVSMTQNNTIISDIDVGQTYTINIYNPSNMYCTYQINYNIFDKSFAKTDSSNPVLSNPTVNVLSGFAILTMYDESTPPDKYEPTSTSLI